MKFIVDHQLPPTLARWLIARGHQANHVFMLGLGEADDDKIWLFASSQAAVVITKDADFAERRGRTGEGPAVVWLRIGNSTTPNLLVWLDARWAQVEGALASGAGVVEVR